MDKKFKVLDIFPQIDPESMKMLTDIAEVRTFALADCSGEKMLKEVRDVNAIILSSAGLVDAKVMENAPNLKVVGRAGAGYQNVDIEAATKRGIAVVFSGSANSDTVADLTFGLILSVARNISWADHTCKTTQDNKWDFGTGMKFMGTDVWNKTLGIIGFGKIGSRVAKRARGFDMSILVYDPYLKEKGAKEEGCKYVDLPTLLKGSDFVTIHSPFTEETNKLIGEKEMKMMKDGAYIINAAFGGIIDEDALYKALIEGKLGGAAIECPETKKGELTFNPQKPIYRLKNVVLTPMLGGRTKECGPRTARMMVEGVVKVLKGEKPTWIVNPSILR